MRRQGRPWTREQAQAAGRIGGKSRAHAKLANLRLGPAAAVAKRAALKAQRLAVRAVATQRAREVLTARFWNTNINADEKVEFR